MLGYKRPARPAAVDLSLQIEWTDNGHGGLVGWKALGPK
jgi:hypothetical protein